MNPRSVSSMPAASTFNVSLLVCARSQPKCLSHRGTILALRSLQKSAAMRGFDRYRILLELKVHMGRGPRFIKAEKVMVMFVEGVHPISLKNSQYRISDKIPRRTYVSESSMSHRQGANLSTTLEPRPTRTGSSPSESHLPRNWNHICFHSERNIRSSAFGRGICGRVIECRGGRHDLPQPRRNS